MSAAYRARLLTIRIKKLESDKVITGYCAQVAELANEECVRIYFIEVRHVE